MYTGISTRSILLVNAWNILTNIAVSSDSVKQYRTQHIHNYFLYN